jgi:hypothetical protein
LARLVPFLFATVLALSCKGQYINEWYDDASPEKSSAGAADITLYCFVNPVGVGVSGGGSGSADDPSVINITYPFGTSVPASDADIKIIVHPGASFAADGPWINKDGVFIRSYTVTAQDGTQKHYQVRAFEADSTGTASSGNIGAFQFSATNGLLEGHVNTQSGAVAGVFSDPSAGVYPFTYTLENNTDLFEIVVEDDTAFLKITSPLEAKSPWIIRVRVTDSAGSFYAGPVQFVVNQKEPCGPSPETSISAVRREDSGYTVWAGRLRERSAHPLTRAAPRRSATSLPPETARTTRTTRASRSRTAGPSRSKGTPNSLPSRIRTTSMSR